MLELKKVSKGFQLPAGDEKIEVLKDVSLKVEAAETVAVIGPSGSGKSTFLNMAGILDKPDSGEVLIDNENTSAFDDKKLAETRNQKIGFIFQLHHLLPQCTVLENVLVPTIPLKSQAGIEDFNQRVLRLLTRVGLKERLSHYPAQLSGGELQRVAVVRALINNPQIILADEPTGSLDHKSAIQLIELLLELNKEENTTLILVTHSSEIAAMMEKTYLLKDKTLVLK